MAIPGPLSHITGHLRNGRGWQGRELLGSGLISSLAGQRPGEGGNGTAPSRRCATVFQTRRALQMTAPAVQTAGVGIKRAGV